MSWHRRDWLLRLVLIPLLLVLAAPLLAQEAATPLGRTGLSVSLPRDPQFEPAAGFNGLVSPETGATVHAEILARPFSEVAADFNAEALSRQGITLAATSQQRFGRWDGYLLELRQREGDIAYQKMAALFGDRSFTALAVVTFTANLERRYSETFRRIALSLTGYDSYLSSDPFSVGFDITPVQPFASAREATGAIGLFTPGGAAPAEGALTPVFAVEPRSYPGDLPAPDAREDFAKELVNEIAGATSAEVQAVEQLLIDDLPAVQLVARARLASDFSRRLRVYQAVIFLEHGYFLHRGLAPMEAEDVLSAFVAMSESFRRVPPTEPETGADG